jgi:amidophosphoribosyltransferase
MIRSAGASEVHMRISSPPTVGPCHYGIDTPTREELIASHNTVTQIRDFVAADSVGYLSLPGLYTAVEGSLLLENGEPKASDGKGFCDACFSGNYPIDPEPPGRPRQLRLINA